MINPLQALQRSIAFIAIVSTLLACYETPEIAGSQNVTGIKVFIYYDEALQIDQLKIEGWSSSQESAFDEALLPEAPTLLEGTEQTFALLLPDTLANTPLRIAIDAYSDGSQVAAGQQNVMPILSKVIRVNIRLSADNVCEQDQDNDGICDSNDPCIDLDGDGFGTTQQAVGCPQQGFDIDDTDSLVCADTDSDNCDDCSQGVYDPLADGEDNDGDGICDRSDPCTDADLDGFGNGSLNNRGCEQEETDWDDTDFRSCIDSDEDGCDDCSGGTFSPGSDGIDSDNDGICDLGDTCTDFDGDGLGVGEITSGCLNPTVDSDDSSPTICADTDYDGCNDCASGEWNPSNDGPDNDADGICNISDDCIDADNDGVCLESDCDDTNPNCQSICIDADSDGFCSDFDCDDTFPTCSTDCITNSDALDEITSTIDCIEVYCGSDPTDGDSNCSQVNSATELGNAIATGATNILVGEISVTNNLPALDENQRVTIRQVPGASISVSTNVLFRVNVANATFKDLVIYVEQANEVFDINNDNTELDRVTIISAQNNEPREGISISSANNTIKNSQILGFEERGVEIKGNNANDNQILNTVITGGSDAAQLAKAAILVENASGTSIIGNVLVENNVSAINLRRATNTMVAHNTIAQNFNGVTFTSNGNWNGFENWRSLNTCIRNNSITGHNAGVSQYYTYTTWDESAQCASVVDNESAYGNNTFNNQADCSPSCYENIPSGVFWEYKADPEFQNTTREGATVPIGYYCLGALNELQDAARDLGYDRNGSQQGAFNGILPDVGGRETGTPTCPE